MIIYTKVYVGDSWGEDRLGVEFLIERIDSICLCTLLYYRCRNSYTTHVARQVVLVSCDSWKLFLSFSIGLPI